MKNTKKIFNIMKSVTMIVIMVLFTAPTMAQNDSLTIISLSNANKAMQAQIVALKKAAEDKFATEVELKADASKSLSILNVNDQEAVILPSGVKKDELYTGSLTIAQELELTKQAMANDKEISLKELEVTAKSDFMLQEGHEEFDPEKGLVMYDADGNPDVYDRKTNKNKVKISRQDRKLAEAQTKLVLANNATLEKAAILAASEAEANRQHQITMALLLSQQSFDNQLTMVRVDNAHEEALNHQDGRTERSVERSVNNAGPNYNNGVSTGVVYRNGMYRNAGGQLVMRRSSRVGCTANCN